MAEIIATQTCTNCRHRHTKSTFKRCVDCIDTGNGNNRFPGWQADEEKP